MPSHLPFAACPRSRHAGRHERAAPQGGAHPQQPAAGTHPGARPASQPPRLRSLLRLPPLLCVRRSAVSWERGGSPGLHSLAVWSKAPPFPRRRWMRAPRSSTPSWQCCRARAARRPRRRTAAFTRSGAEGRLGAQRDGRSVVVWTAGKQRQACTAGRAWRQCPGHPMGAHMGRLGLLLPGKGAAKGVIPKLSQSHKLQQLHRNVPASREQH